MNSIMILMPYKYYGSWVFDDPAVGLVREPFVAGIDTMIDQMVKDIPDAENGFKLWYSPRRPFPGIGSGWNGGEPNPAETGTTRRT